MNSNINDIDRGYYDGSLLLAPHATLQAMNPSYKTTSTAAG
jgi:hypothetical protein